MKPTRDPRSRLGIATWFGGVSAAAAAGLLLWTSVAATPPTEAELLCPTGVGGSLSANSTRLTTESKLFQASYSTTDWTGGLRAIGLNTDGKVSDTALWSANDLIPDFKQRNIFTSSNTTTGIDFTSAALGSELLLRIGGEEVLNYLRGDTTNERSAENPDGLLRPRKGRLLGAIVNSEIAYAGLEDFGYEALIDPKDDFSAPSPATVAGLAYPAYRQTKSSRTKLVIVGANDGMLHGFDAATGVEKFAYLPRTLLEETETFGDKSLSTLVRLAYPEWFSPRYYVDGSPWVGDAYWGGAWHTAVVGTTGAGGKGVFALDITDPDHMVAGKLLWDLDGREDANMGYAFGEPVIGRLHDGNFYAIFGNGRESVNQCPVLYLVRLGSGQVFKRMIPTGGRALTASCGTAPNGLGRPSLYDIDTPGSTGFRTTDFVYAGDLQGNVWRFDLRSVNLNDTAGDPPFGASVQLIFTASNDDGKVQPITGLIEIGAAPSAVGGELQPAMLWFGTGRYLTAKDRENRDVQSMYGFVDQPAANKTIERSSDLLKRLTVSNEASDGGTISYRVDKKVNEKTVDYKSQKGWYIDLPAAERFVGSPLIQSGRLFFATLIPAPNVVDCEQSDGSSIYAVDPYHGTELGQRAFVQHTGMDFIASTVGMVRSLAAIDAGTKAYLYLGGTKSAGDGFGAIQFEEIEPLPQGGPPRGRVSWREIVK